MSDFILSRATKISNNLKQKIVTIIWSKLHWSHILQVLSFNEKQMKLELIFSQKYIIIVECKTHFL